MDIMGRNKANPTAMILSASMMLRHLGLDNFANDITKATYSVLEEGKVRTDDIGGNSSTTEFTKAILNKLDTI
jgi:isocitrate dehydrogenase (NAD+)